MSPFASAVTDAPPAGRAELLDRTYRRFAELFTLLRTETGGFDRRDERWLTARRLAGEAGLAERLAGIHAARMADLHGVAPRPDVAATDLLHRYAFVACLAFSGPWYLERRVPWFSPEGLGLDEAGGVLAVDPWLVSVGPDDPAAGMPGVRVVAGEEALRGELRRAVAEFLEPVLERMGPLMRRRRHAQWAMATDELAEGIHYLGRLLGDMPAAALAANEVLPGGTAPYAGGAGYRLPPATASCDAEPARTRQGCCFFYTLKPDLLCESCPRSR
ncbi:(2Fe-2S)-binding protein [Streptomyces sp. YIM 98790]|uniref:(2Fe-2S)-binding protein n=1 Tax=Streptomyces sp. YIM 98790 TaxID=2689077 RepID=UPI00140C2DA1|nr:(2Fe-2S)-binding protein [Streptomyces sp. YIM 98790]